VHLELMRALIATILALIALSLANAAWRERRAGGRVEVEMCVWGMPFENALYLNEYIPEFEKQNPKIKVRFHHFDNYSNRILMLRAGGIAPDVIRENTNSEAQAIRRGMNLPLDKFMDGPDGIDRNDFIPGTLDALHYNGQTYGIPQDVNIRGLYFNKDLFDAAKIPYPDENWTWEQLKEAAARLANPATNGGKKGVTGLLTGMKSQDWFPFYYQAGGRVWNEAQDAPEFVNERALRSLAFFRSVSGGFLMSQSTSQRGGLGLYTYFQNGQAAMLIDGSWRTPQLKKDGKNLRFGVAPLPRGEKAMSISTSCFWGVSAQTKHPEEAWKLAKFMSSKQALIRYWQTLWVAPPARWSSLRSPEFRHITGTGKFSPAVPTEAEFMEKCGWIPYVLEHGQTTMEFTGPFTNQLYPKLDYALQSILLQGANPKAALEKAERETKVQIAEAQKTFVR
jgi:multiple sugar transport system substrate-binding protein